MAEGQRERDWSLLSTLMALVANCHRSSKTKPFKPADFNPTIEKKKKLLTKEEFRQMCQKFFGKKK
jgi:hypothetical protein